MKKLYSLSAFFLCIGWLNAQITVTAADFASAGNTVQMSNATVNQLIDHYTTGAAINWDFGSLQYSSGYTDNFVQPISELLYALDFTDISFNPYKANIAEPGAVPSPEIPLLTIDYTNTVNFYYKSSSKYEEPGFGAEINGFPDAVLFTNQDVIYNFPIEYGNSDTSASGYSIDLPSVGFYGYQQTRTNSVDGWGTVTTPFGEFQALRVVTQIQSADTFYIPTINEGIAIPQLIQHQYKWIANGQMEPVLQINTESALASLDIEYVTSIVYRDTVHPPPPPPVNSAISEPGANALAFNVFPNPAGAKFTVSYPSNIAHTILTLADITGRTVLSREMESNVEEVNTSSFERGVYLVTLNNGNQKEVRRIVLE